ncbi:MAG TPA: hypothetical protein VJH75_00580 [Patescibacteria group bacterium]|nr:hypothetical protein [Patescibacteria group bacterium]
MATIKEKAKKLVNLLFGFLKKEKAIEEESKKLVQGAVKEADQKKIEELKNKINNL